MGARVAAQQIQGALDAVVWHWLVPGDPRWGDLDGAMRAFLPDTKHRQWRIRCGWTVTRDDGELLNVFLSQAKPGDTNGDDVRN